MLAGDARLEGEIVFDREARDQVELLKNQPEPVAPQRRAAGVGKAGDVGVAQPDLAAIGGVEPRDQVQQRALAASRICRVSATRSPAAMSRLTPRSTAISSPAVR